jgi:hypothetical protein
MDHADGSAYSNFHRPRSGFVVFKSFLQNHICSVLTDIADRDPPLNNLSGTRGQPASLIQNQEQCAKGLRYHQHIIHLDDQTAVIEEDLTSAEQVLRES